MRKCLHSGPARLTRAWVRATFRRRCARLQAPQKFCSQSMHRFCGVLLHFAHLEKGKWDVCETWTYGKH
ncbi:hypothetical protein DPMN_123777 [Dreissena polymorpha]|uniref:Uncharacterized protein n=1 Tax=Dreissena polymorpha TaxID=45954 RepID=A0A9D4GS90_DREPO|nr:hypothetical protein DPMN_123777 [Dreissena polymorpha]